MPQYCQPTPGLEPLRQSAGDDHRVEFYDSDAGLVDAVAGFTLPAVTHGVAVVVAEPEHRRGVAAALAASGVDVDAAVTGGRLVLLDAHLTLEQFLIGGSPHPAAFHAVIGSVLRAASHQGGPVRVYGEMVTVLWEQGRVDAAMTLEGLWNEAAGTYAFQLLCGYPSTLFGQPESSRGFADVCRQHSVVTVPPDEVLTRLAAHAGRRGQAAERAMRWRLPAELAAGGAARTQLRMLLDSWQLGDHFDVAELLVTELVNNAVLHARSRVLVSVHLRHDGMRVEVTDQGDGAFHRLDAGPEDTSGRGLLLVEALSSAWGTALHSGAKTVWFELPSTSEA